ncbi:MAG: hypothetical protein LOD92_08795, partial [Bacillales bacterium]
DMDISYKGKSAGTVRPEKIFYSTWPEPSSEVAIKTVASQDLYVVLSTWENEDKATFQLKVNPFVSWIWIGGFIMVFGIIVALLGGKTRKLAAVSAVNPEFVKAGVSK